MDAAEGIRRGSLGLQLRLAVAILLSAAWHTYDSTYGVCSVPFARTVCDFILNDLNRSEETSDEVCFSYSPLDRTQVFNASLLAGETLASVGSMTGEDSLCDWAARAAQYVVRHQRPDGSWAYGTEDYQSRSDNFHTAFLLTSLSGILRALAESERAGPRHDPHSEDGERAGGEVLAQKTLRQSLPNGEGEQSDFASQAEGALRHGYEYWRERFFLTNGWPKYYPGRLYPADVHSAATAIVALSELQHLDPAALEFAKTIARWAIDNLMDRRGFFYYQGRRLHMVRIPYMRWSQAWMTYALARLLEGKGKKEKGKN